MSWYKNNICLLQKMFLKIQISKNKKIKITKSQYPLTTAIKIAGVFSVFCLFGFFFNDERAIFEGRVLPILTLYICRSHTLMLLDL